MNETATLAVALVVAGAVTLAWLWRRRLRRPVTPRAARDHDDLVAEVRRLVMQGQTAEAEGLLQEQAAATAHRFGPRSPEHARALFDLSAVLTVIDDLRRAADALRQAVAIEPTDEESRKARLTYLMNLGEVLTRDGKLDEAERVLSGSLDERLAFYGPDHAGYAYGAESLAEVKLARGQTAEALRLADAAYRVFLSAGHQQLPGAAALRALARKRSDRAMPAFDGDATPQRGPDEAAALTDEVLRGVAASVQLRAAMLGEDIAVAVMEDVEALFAARPGRRRERLDALSAQIMMSQLLPECDTAIAALTRKLALLAEPGDLDERVETLEALALQHSRAGAAIAAEQAYHDALAAAQPLGAARASRVHRNLGLFLAEQGRRPEAGEHLTAALELARSCDVGDALGQALVARGVFLQHGGEGDAARPLLEEALRTLPPDAPNALVARTHLKAAVEKRPCQCDRDMPEATAEAVREMIADQLPPDLIRSVAIKTRPAGPPDIIVEVKRNPSADERQLIDRLVAHATSRLRRNIRREQGGSPQYPSVNKKTHR